jgi:hypothetical protein
MVWDETSTTQLACDDDGCSGNYQSEIDFNADVNTTYIIVVDGYDLNPESMGDFDLVITAP